MLLFISFAFKNTVLDTHLVHSTPPYFNSDILALQNACWGNMAACYLKMEKFRKCVEYCDKVLEKTQTNAKVRRRRRRRSRWWT